MKTGNEARLFLGMTASGWAAGGVGQQRRLLDSAGGEGGWGILGLLSFPLAVMLPSSARREDLTAGLPRGFPGRSSTDTGRSRMPTGSCGQEDRLTRGASENPPLCGLPARRARLVFRVPAAPWLLSGMRLSKSLLSFFPFTCICNWCQRSLSPCHVSLSLDCFPSDSHDLPLWVCT